MQSIPASRISHDVGAPPDLTVKALERIGRTQLAPVAAESIARALRARRALRRSATCSSSTKQRHNARGSVCIGGTARSASLPVPLGPRGLGRIGPVGRGDDLAALPAV